MYRLAVFTGKCISTTPQLKSGSKNHKCGTCNIIQLITLLKDLMHTRSGISEVNVRNTIKSVFIEKRQIFHAKSSLHKPS